MSRLPTPRRDPLVDALRALAMVGVIAVNALSYPVAPWGAPLGEPEPAGWVALGLQGLVALLLHGKAYPLLAFLFGAGLVMAGRRASPAAQRGRLWRLLALGVVHGALLYCGDILTMYALCGFLVLGSVHARPGVLRRRLRVALVLAAAALVAGVWLALASAPGGYADAAEGFGQAAGWGALWRLNLEAYAWLQGAALLLFLPLLRAAMLAGVLAARLRLLTHRRWRPLWRRWLRWTLLPGLLLNAVYAVGIVDAVARRDDSVTLWLAVLPCVGWLLTVAAVALAVLARGRWAALLAPLGRRTLSLYLLHSLLCVALLSGAGAGWALPTPAGVVWTLVLWLGGLVVARGFERRGWRGPAEAWLAGR